MRSEAESRTGSREGMRSEAESRTGGRERKGRRGPKRHKGRIRGCWLLVTGYWLLVQGTGGAKRSPVPQVGSTGFWVLGSVKGVKDIGGVVTEVVT